MKLIPESIPETKRGTEIYKASLARFKGEDFESARIERDDFTSAQLYNGYKNAIRAFGLQSEIGCCVRNGQMYLFKKHDEV